MSSSLQKILDSKRKMRRDLASRPIAEKLRLLDQMRAREVSIAAAGHSKRTTGRKKK